MLDHIMTMQNYKREFLFSSREILQWIRRLPCRLLIQVQFPALSMFLQVLPGFILEPEISWTQPKMILTYNLICYKLCIIYII